MEINDLIKDLRKKYEDDYILLMSDELEEQEIKAIPSGSMALDIATGCGGIPMGRITELYGIESTGKTTLCQHIVANAQKMGLTCAYIDTEQAIDPDYLEICGVDISKLLISQPDTLNVALSLTEDLINSGEVKLIIFDSVVGLSTSAEKEKEIGERSVSSIAGILTQYLKKNMYNIRTNNVAMVFTNQARDVIGAYVPMVQGTGGHALKHYASLRIQTSKAKEIKDKDEVIGMECKANVKKNKVGGLPGRIAEFEIYYGKGIYRPADVLKSAIELGVVTLRGSHNVFNGEIIANSKANTIKLLGENVELLNQIELEIRRA